MTSAMPSSRIMEPVSVPQVCMSSQGTCGKDEAVPLPMLNHSTEPPGVSPCPSGIHCPIEGSGILWRPTLSPPTFPPGPVNDQHIAAYSTSNPAPPPHGYYYGMQPYLPPPPFVPSGPHSFSSGFLGPPPAQQTYGRPPSHPVSTIKFPQTSPLKFLPDSLLHSWESGEPIPSLSYEKHPMQNPASSKGDQQSVYHYEQQSQSQSYDNIPKTFQSQSCQPYPDCRYPTLECDARQYIHHSSEQPTSTSKAYTELLSCSVLCPIDNNRDTSTLGTLHGKQSVPLANLDPQNEPCQVKDLTIETERGIDTCDLQTLREHEEKGDSDNMLSPLEIDVGHPEEEHLVHLAEQSQDEEILPQLSCLICASEGTLADVYNIFDSSLLMESSNRTLLNRLTSILNVKLREESLHTTFLCEKCFRLVSSVDELHAKLIKEVSHLKRIFYGSLKASSVYLYDVALPLHPKNNSSQIMKFRKSYRMHSKRIKIKYKNVANTHMEKRKCHGQKRKFKSSTTEHPCHLAQEKDQVVSAMKDNWQQQGRGSNGSSEPSPLQACERDKQDRVCPHCCKRFKWPSDLRRHINMHTHDITFECQKCHKYFSMKSNLDKHVVICYGKFRHICEKCGKGFLTKKLLNVHIDTHDGKYPFICNICKRGFLKRSDLQVHKRIHTQERPYSCPICGKSFSNSGNCNSHVQIHSSVKLFKCSFCCKYFSKQQYLRVHFKNVHGKKPADVASKESLGRMHMLHTVPQINDGVSSDHSSQYTWLGSCQGEHQE